MDESCCWTVYQHITPSNKVYIGITSNTPARRWDCGRGYKGQVFYNAIKKYGWDNIKHEIIATQLTFDQAALLEQLLIKEYQSNDHVHGYNIDNGGKAHKYTDEMRKRASELHKGKPGTPWSKERLEKASYKVSQFTLDGKLIQVFSSVNDAARATGISDSTISNACKGNYKTGKGYVWRYGLYNTDIRTGINNKPTNAKEICAYDINGVFYKEYKKIRDVSIDGHIPECIHNCLSGRSIKHHNLYWFYKNECINNDGEIKKSIQINRKSTSSTANKKSSNKTYRGKEILAVDDQGIIIKEYDSIKSAVADGYNDTNISACLHGKQKKHAGLFWILKESIAVNSINNSINKEHKRRKDAKPIFRLDKFGKILSEYECASDVAKDGFSPSAVRSCLYHSNRVKKHSGYVFVFKDDYDRVINDISKYYTNETYKTILQIDKNGMIINQYNKISDASKDGFSITAISNCLSGRAKSHQGYIWQHAS